MQTTSRLPDSPASPAPHEPIAHAARLCVDGLRSPHGGPFSFEVGAGECVVVMGASGSGKSVMLRLIADLDPGTGDARLDGASRQSMSGPAWRRQVVYQAAQPGWWAATPAAHFEVGMRPFIESTMASLGMEALLLHSPIDRLSSGERQRMALLLTVSMQPKVMLLDEPTASLDAASVLAAELLIREQLARGCAVVLVTHSIEQAERMGHRRFLLRDKTLHAA